ncbi:MAG: HDOD domain-containing protein [Spirochaetaceae bacterium]|jgi:putative nucleotidyltransferase with HDIG domain|nr:HDOD domain-containing protein [Spirochaetaceae bacterium]
MNKEDELIVDENTIKNSIRSGIPLTITTYTLPHDVEMYIVKVLAVFLRMAGHENLRDYIEYCIQELSVNAKKANTKRVYFMEKCLDINNPDQYKEGMLTFKKDIFNDITHYLKLQKDKGLYIKIIMLYSKDALQIEVRNNVVVSKIELIRIHDKIARSRQYNSLEDAFSQVLDDSEGAGLGLVVLILMLKKMGLTEDCFDITKTESETVAKLVVPLEQTVLANVTGVTKEIVAHINDMPHFPENIIRVQNMLSDPKSDMKDIAGKILIDPAMTADIIKVVNSAQYMTTKKIDSISEAVKILGITGIKNLLYSYGTQKLLGDDTEEKKRLWKHSYKTAFFAFNLVKNFQHDKSYIEDIYMGGILHDMGKIVLADVNPELTAKMEAFCREKNIPAVTLEDIKAGMNHAEVGALLAEKWNFPENLVAAIRFHHTPGDAPEKYRLLVDAVYLANMLCAVEYGCALFEQLDGSVLSRFNITNSNQIEKIIDAFSKGFNKEKA